MLVPQRDGLSRPVDTFKGSVLWAIAACSDQMRTMLWWTELDTIWFLLTGTTPPMYPVSAQTKTVYNEDASPALDIITLQVFPFVSARTVFRAQARVRRRLQRFSPSRAMQVWNLKLFEFVEERREDPSKKPQWSRLMLEWNGQARPAWKYSHRGNFRRDYLRARTLLLESDSSDS